VPLPHQHALFTSTPFEPLNRPLPTPQFPCGVEGEVGTIAAADLQMLTDWLAAAAPDGTAWP
jgi:hypothetical protein